MRCIRVITALLPMITSLIDLAKRCRALCLRLIRSGFTKYTSENARQPDSIVLCLSVALVTNLSKRGRIRASRDCCRVVSGMNLSSAWKYRALKLLV